MVARQIGDGEARVVKPIDPAAWLGVRIGFVPSYPQIVHVHHMATFPKKGTKPPVAIEQLMTNSNGLNVASWSLFEKPDVWCYRSSKTVKINGEIHSLFRRDGARLASLFKNAGPAAQFSIVAEQVMACWDYPLRAAGDNEHRTSVKQMTGVSPARVRHPDELYDRAKNGPATASDIPDNMEPFRRMVVAQGLRPLVVALGLIPTSAGAEGLRFADNLYTQAAAYAVSQSDAEALLQAYRNVIWYLVRSGYSPVMSPHRTNDDVICWSTVLTNLEPTRKIPLKGNGRTQTTATATGEQFFTIAPLKQFKSFNDTVMEELRGYMRQSKNPLIRDAGLIGVPFEGLPRANGDYLSGCFMALVTGPELNRNQLRKLAGNVTIVMDRVIYRRPQAAAAAAPVSRNPAQSNARKDHSARAKLNIRMAKEHDKLWTAFDVVCAQPEGRRMKRMRADFPEAFALFKQYPKVKALIPDIEHANKVSALAEAAWKAMAGTSATQLYRWRAKAGLPSRRLR